MSSVPPWGTLVKPRCDKPYRLGIFIDTHNLTRISQAVKTRSHSDPFTVSRRWFSCPQAIRELLKLQRSVLRTGPQSPKIGLQLYPKSDVRGFGRPLRLQPFQRAQVACGSKQTGEIDNRGLENGGGEALHFRLVATKNSGPGIASTVSGFRFKKIATRSYSLPDSRACHSLTNSQRESIHMTHTRRARPLLKPASAQQLDNYRGNMNCAMIQRSDRDDICWELVPK
jgi:hypothetical protein